LSTLSATLDLAALSQAPLRTGLKPAATKRQRTPLLLSPPTNMLSPPAYSLPLREIDIQVGEKVIEAGIIDPGSQIVVMREDLARAVGAAIITICVLQMERANGATKWTLGCAEYLPMCIGDLLFAVHAHVVECRPARLRTLFRKHNCTLHLPALSFLHLPKLRCIPHTCRRTSRHRTPRSLYQRLFLQGPPHSPNHAPCQHPLSMYRNPQLSLNLSLPPPSPLPPSWAYRIPTCRDAIRARLLYHRAPLKSSN
jgi:hypothetical protein